MRELKRLRFQHYAIIRLAFQGWSNVRIAERVGVTRGSVSRVLHSRLAQAELERMREEAEERLVNMPLRLKLMRDLDGTSIDEALRLRPKLRKERLKALHRAREPLGERVQRVVQQPL